MYDETVVVTNMTVLAWGSETLAGNLIVQGHNSNDWEFMRPSERLGGATMIPGSDAGAARVDVAGNQLLNSRVSVLTSFNERAYVRTDFEVYDVCK